MPSQGTIRAGLAFVEVSLKDSPLTKGLKKAGKSLKDFGGEISAWGKKIAEIGAGITAPLLGASKVFADMGAELARASSRTGASVEWLSSMGFAAEQTGTDFESLEKGVRKMQKTITEAAEGNKGAVDSLELLGLTVKDLSGLSPEKQFELIGKRIAGINDPTIKAAAALQIFGRSGTSLLPMLDNMDALQAEARELGVVISKEDATAALELEESMGKAYRVLKQTAFVVGAALAPTLEVVASTIIKTVVAANEWIKKNQSIVLTVLKVGAAAIVVGVALLGLGYAITSIGAVLAGIASIVAGVGAAFGVMAAILGAILSPLGLTIAAIVALGAYIVLSTKVGAAALTWLGKQFADLASWAKESFGAIGNALAAGDISAAAKVLWASLNLAWQTGVSVLDKVWATVMEAMVDVAIGAFDGVLAAAEEVWHALKTAWTEGTAFLQKIWQDLMTAHSQAVEGMANAMVKAWIWAQEKTGAITSDQAKSERDYEDKQTQGDMGEIDADKQKKLDALNASHDKDETAEKDRHDAAMAKIGKDYNDLSGGAAAVKSDAVKKAQDDLDAATAVWKDAVKNANKAGGKHGPDGGPPKLPGVGPDDDELNDLLEAKQHKIGVRGTFNASDARSLATGGASDKIAASTAQTAVYAQKIYNTISNAQPATYGN